MSSLRFKNPVVSNCRTADTRPETDSFSPFLPLLTHILTHQTPSSSKTSINTPQRLGHITPEKLRKFQPTLIYWGAGAAGAVGLFLSSVPIFKHDILHKVPIINLYFKGESGREGVVWGMLEKEGGKLIVCVCYSFLFFFCVWLSFRILPLASLYGP